MLLQYHLAGNLVLINCQNINVEIVLYKFNMLNVCQPVFSIKSMYYSLTCYRTLELTCVYMQTRVRAHKHTHTMSHPRTHTHVHTQSSSFTQNRLQLILHNVPLVLC